MGAAFHPAGGGVPLQILPPDLRIERLKQELSRRDVVERDREVLSKSLRAYVPEAWKIVNPATEFVGNWHIDAICDHLQALISGQIRNLLITMPPRHMKSWCTCVFLPTWIWTFKPDHKFLFTSYAQVLSVRDAVRSRRLIESDWYQDRWGHLFGLTDDQNVKSRYENDKTGYRISSSVDGTATGEGGDLIGCDDPHNMREIHSDVVRESVLTWWDEVMSSRLNDRKTGARFIIMQRGHEGDLAGHVLRKGGWEHLNLPAEYELDKRKTVIGWSDPRTEKGELLCPQRFGHKELAEMKVELGPWGAAAQLQQRPAPEEGGIFKRAWFPLWPADAKLPMLHFVVQSYDTAFTEKTFNDPTACIVFGVFKHPKFGYHCALVCDAWRERMEYPDLRKRVKMDLRARYGEKGQERRADLVLVEEKGSGITLLQDLRLVGVPAFPYNPGKADKVTRAHAAAPFVAAQRIWLLESAKNKGLPVSWVEEMIHELLTFPNSLRDDFVDAFTQAVVLLRNNEIIEAKVKGVEEEEKTPEAVYQEYANPYAQ